MGANRAWLLAIRPRTLPAAVSPVLVGSAAAAAEHAFRPFPALAALAGALLLQIGVNLANDYFDSVRGIDTPERLGPVRVTQTGLIPPGRVLAGMILSFVLAAGAGIYLISAAGWPILAIGCASILAAVLYSGGPYPLASHGLGDAFAFFFFGPVAVCGTYYVQALGVSFLCGMLSLSVGFLVAAILVVNNLRDIPTDSRVGKRTLAVILGPERSRKEFVLLWVMAYGLLVGLWLAGSLSAWGFLPLLTLPQAVFLARSLWVLTGASLNAALAGSARLTLVFCLLLSVGLVIPRLSH